MDLTRVTWRKSSYSSGNAGNCVEVATVWRKSSYSSGNAGQCVEVATGFPRAVAVRDSKDPGGPTLVTSPAGWRAFTRQLKDRRFDPA